MNKVFIVSAGFAIAFLISCSTSLKRYRSASQTGNDNTLADADLFSSRISATNSLQTKKTLLDLTAEAQAQFIRIMNTRYPDNGSFLNSLYFEFLPAANDPVQTDYIKKDLRMVFSVSRKRGYHDSKGAPLLTEADRLEYLKLTVVLDEPFVKFTGWNMYTTEYGSVEIGDVSFSKSLGTDLSASIPVKINSIKSDLSPSVNAAISRKEDQQVKYRYIKLNGKLNDTVLVMEEEGTRETDLTGNIIADVSIRFRSAQEYVTRIYNLYDSAGKITPPGKLILKSSIVEIPDVEFPQKEIGAKLILDYVYRNVTGGSKTFPEWDDRIKYYTGHREKHISLLRDADYVPAFFGIGTGQGTAKKELVSLAGRDGSSYRLMFASYSEAADFCKWLKEWLAGNEDKQASAGIYILKFGNAPLTGKIIESNRLFGVIPCFW